ncbi:MAG: hypothetical protein ACM3SY_22425 [Candidatus Omnitrophota bacterium]
MLIANPMYDVVFKYLMENIDVAKGIISAIIDEDIVTLDFKAQEHVRKGEKQLTVYHLDFIAKIRQKNGTYKNVLIELQKSNVPYDIVRFREYLGEQYTKVDEVLLADGKTVSREPLPIVTIYFLGFFISKTLPAVIKVNREYIDVLNGKEIHEKNVFIELLTHNSYVIQVPKLKPKMRSRLEWILSIFCQENFIESGNRRLKSYDYEPEDSLMQIILRQLQKAAGDKKLMKKLKLEEMAEREYESAFGEIERKLMKNEIALKETRQELEETLTELEKSQIELEHKDKELEHKDKELERKEQLLKEQEAYIKELLKKSGG